MRRPRSALPALLICAACAGSGDPGADGVRVDTIAGVPHVLNEGVPPAWRLERERVVGILGGADDGPSPEEFGQIQWLALDARARLYVADGATRQIQVFDTAGAHVRTIGREGGGPGEFGRIQAMAVLGDTLVVMDDANRRIGLLSLEGAWLGQWPGGPGSGPIDWLHTMGPAEAAMLTLQVRPEGVTRAYVYVRPGGPLDTLAVPPTPERALTVAINCDTHDGAIHFWSDPVAPSHLNAPTPERLLARAWSDAYRIAFLSQGGDTVRVVARPTLTTSVPDSMGARLDADYRAWRDRMPFEATCDPAGRAGYDVLPPLEHIAFDVDGRMWVETLTGEGRAWDVFSPDGRLLGRAPVPARYERVRPAIRDGRVAVVEEAPEGFHRVVVYRLAEGG